MRCRTCGAEIERVTYRSGGDSMIVYIDDTGDVHDCTSPSTRQGDALVKTRMTWDPVEPVQCPRCGIELWGGMCRCDADTMRSRFAAARQAGLLVRDLVASGQWPLEPDQAPRPCPGENNSEATTQ